MPNILYDMFPDVLMIFQLRYHRYFFQVLRCSECPIHFFRPGRPGVRGPMPDLLGEPRQVPGRLLDLQEFRWMCGTHGCCDDKIRDDQDKS